MLVRQDDTAIARVDFSGVAVRAVHERTWTPALARFGRSGVGAIAFDRAGNMYIGTTGGVYVSENLGSTFRGILPLRSEVMSVLILEGESSTRSDGTFSWSGQRSLLVGTRDGTLFRSPDGGSSWQKVSAGTIGMAKTVIASRTF